MRGDRSLKVFCALALLTCAALAACAAPAARTPQDRPDPNLVPDAVVAAARTAIDQINDTAGGPVADQRAALEELAAPDEAEAQDRCPEARSTLRFDPAYRDLRQAPGGSAGEYLLPTYITIFTGDRITGSDVATIRLWIGDTGARTAALCVS